MKITGIIASTLLLLAPALVSALPTSENNLLAGAESCDAKRPKSGPPLVKFNDREKKMKAATAEAKKAASKCPDSKRADFTAEKNKQKRELMKSSCVNSWTRSKSEREKANTLCLLNGATHIDAGHLQAVTFCQNEINYWNGQNP